MTKTEFDADTFAAAVIKQYKKARPNYSPPHSTIFKVAKEAGQTAVINKMTEAVWNEKYKQFDEDDDEHPELDRVFDDLKVEIAGQILKFEWLNCGLVKYHGRSNRKSPWVSKINA